VSHPAQLRVVGTAFLRQRPLVGLPIGLANFTLFVLAGAPRIQLVALGAVFGSLQAMFWIERARGARHPISEAAFARSLVIAMIALAAGCAISGGLASPVVPVLLAPPGIGFAAFGRSRTSTALLGLLAACAVALALLPRGPFPVLARPYLEIAIACGLAGGAVLLRLGVAALAEAHAGATSTLARAGDDAAARTRELESLGARVAHEVKNPLAAIRGLVEVMIEARAGDERDHKRLTVVAGEVARIEGILRDYLDHHRPTTALERARVDVGELARDVAAVLEARAERAHIAIAASGPALVAEVDPRRLKEAMLNLTLNALSASGPGQRIELRWHDRVGETTIEIHDTGRGMTADELARIGTPGFTTRSDGTGLGVALARGIIEQHGGTLRFTSTPGRGTIATISLPS
jgi:signal transduction histidine kinase